MQMSDAQIHNIRQQISRQVAFPEEMSARFEEASAREFLRDVAACGSMDELDSFTALLPRRRLNDLFGALLVVSAAEGEELVLRLLQILRQRLTPSLAEIGWAFFQHHFPNDRMSRVLSTIIGGLADRGSEISYLRAVARVSDLPIIDDTLPARLAGRLSEKPDLQLSGYLVEMMIMPDSPFAAELLYCYFKVCPREALAINHGLFIHALRINARESQVELVSHYFSVDRLEPEWEPVNLALLELFGPPRPLQQQKLASLLGRSSDARFWDYLDYSAVSRFRQWSMLYELGRHIEGSSRKKLFYKPCSMEIRELYRWNDKTLALVFDRFVLADSAEDDALIHFYDLPTYQMLHDGSRFNVALNRPQMPAITARDAQLSGRRHNVVSLQLDAVNLLYARDFISEQLKPVRGILK